jgi:hypothetical protein
VSFAMILRIDSSHFSYEESLTMQDAERRWIELGKPTNRRRLAGLLCSMINDCYFNGMEFPPIFSARLRGLRRGTFYPSFERDTFMAEGFCPSLDSDTETTAETPYPPSDSDTVVVEERPAPIYGFQNKNGPAPRACCVIWIQI